MSDCKHELLIAPAADDGRYEHVRCIKCGLEKRRVSVAESIRKQVADDVALLRAELEKVRLEVAVMKDEAARGKGAK